MLFARCLFAVSMHKFMISIPAPSAHIRRKIPYATSRQPLFCCHSRQSLDYPEKSFRAKFATILFAIGVNRDIIMLHSCRLCASLLFFPTPPVRSRRQCLRNRHQRT